jgi:hypothetical protein
MPAAVSAQFVIPPFHSQAGTYGVADRNVISVYELASAWAPTLWFSDYEPLLDPPQPLPTSIPIDPAGSPGDPGVVYYRTTVVTPKGGAGFLASWDISTADASSTEFQESPSCGLPATADDPTPDCLNLDAIDLVRLQYLFYFPKDVGGGSHPHDLEIAEFWFKVYDLGSGLYLVALDHVFGYAHGHKGLANKLDPGRGTPLDPLTLPVTLLIERGKHAPAPDRTMDGVFTPGFDVNEMVADAWGVRDVFGSSWFGSRSYAAWMTLGREKQRKAMFAPAVPPPPEGWEYTLRDFKAATGVAFVPSDLLIYLDYHEYQAMPQNGPSHFLTLRERFGFGARFDLGLGPYVSWMGPEVPFIGGHPVVTAVAGLTYVGSGAWWGGSALYSPSIAGFYNVYGGVTWLQCPTCSSGVGLGPEAGIKVRVPMPQAPSPKFFGVRLGLRYASFSNLGAPRFLVEIGLATP